MKSQAQNDDAREQRQDGNTARKRDNPAAHLTEARPRQKQDREGSSDQWRKYGQVPRGLRQQGAER